MPLSDGDLPLLDGERPRPPPPVLPPPPQKSLRLFAVIAIVFFNVSGGPLGSEQVISSLGPLVGLGSMVLFALIYAVPQAMITAELSTAFPSNGGYSLWVQAAFGTFAGVQESYWSWLSGVVDSAIYPVLLYSTCQQLLQALGDGDVIPDAEGGGVCNATTTAGGGDEGDETVQLWGCMFDPHSGCALEYAIKLATLTLFCLPNVLSDRLVGDLLTVLCLIAMAPFGVLCVLGAPKWKWKSFKRQPATRDWATGLSTVYWNLSGFDSASTFAGEVEAPHKTFPRALLLSVCFVTHANRPHTTQTLGLREPVQSCGNFGDAPLTAQRSPPAALALRFRSF